jgi:mRNA interferase MazF
MGKDFDRWNEKKKRIDEGRFGDYVHEREVWWCAFGVNVGVEADGKHEDFERPALIVRKFSKDAVLAVALTSRPKRNPYYREFKHAGATYAAVISQVRILSTKRLLRKMYVMDERIFEPIRDAVRRMI